MMASEDTENKQPEADAPDDSSPAAASGGDDNVDEGGGGGDYNEDEPPPNRQATGSITVAGVHLSRRQVPLVGIFLASIVLIVAVTSRSGGVNKSGAMYGYAVSVGAVSLVFSFIGFLLTFKEADSEMVQKISEGNSYFLGLWNLAGAVALTFWGPFQTTGNGYFACWALVIFSFMLNGVEGEQVRGVVGRVASSSEFYLDMFLVSAIVVLIAIIPNLTTSEPQTIYAIVLACITIVLTGVLLGMEWKQEGSSKGMAQFGTLAAFAVMWIILAFLLTFRGPFINTGNGYFGSWAGAIFSVFAATAARP